MGTEYYLVKPSKREVFYLGKHIQPMDCIRSKASTVDYISADCFSDFLLEAIETNDGFLDEEYTYKDIKEFVYLLYEWCDSPVYMSSDCSSDYDLFKEYKETGSIIDFCEKHEPLLYRIEELLSKDCSAVEIESCVNAYLSQNRYE